MAKHMTFIVQDHSISHLVNASYLIVVIPIKAGMVILMIVKSPLLSGSRVMSRPIKLAIAEGLIRKMFCQNKKSNFLEIKVFIDK